MEKTTLTDKEFNELKTNTIIDFYKNNGYVFDKCHGIKGRFTIELSILYNNLTTRINYKKDNLYFLELRLDNVIINNLREVLNSIESILLNIIDEETAP